MANNRSIFKSYCPDSMQRIKDIAEDAKSRNCLISLKKNRIHVEVEDPLNSNGVLTFTLSYHSDVENELLSKLDEIDDVLRTLYQPHYIALIPTVKTQLKNTTLEYDDAGAYLQFADGRPTECFGYNHDDYERFVARLSELLLSTNNTAPEKEDHCRSGKHCHNCQNTHCKHSPDYTKDLWSQMDPATQQKFLSKLSAEEQATFLQTIGQEEKQ